MQIRGHRILSTGYVRSILLLASAAACLIAAGVHAADTAARHADETRRDKAAVIAVDEHWSEAEMSGDTAWLDRMLLPEYRSIGPDGTVYSKSAILAVARKHLHSDKIKMRHKAEAWRKAHPSATSVVLRDNVAILSFYDPALGPQKSINSSDIFVYVDGHWHALYSQHASVSKHKTP